MRSATVSDSDHDNDSWYDDDNGDYQGGIDDDDGDDHDEDDDDDDDNLSLFSAPDYNKTVFRRPKSISAIPDIQQPRSSYQHRKQTRRRIGLEERLDDVLLTSHMDIETYLLYERLRQQHLELEGKYKQLQALSKGYEDMAKQLRATYTRRLAEFEQIERHFKLIVDDQVDMEKQLKHVEDDSAKLHYELNVLNDNLMEREENVAGFYSKLEMLEKRMRDDQQSLTTIFIMGNFFKHYWQKMTDFIGWSKD
jgi:predicted  nucleic acid-binding Zn-ribbon protein